MHPLTSADTFGVYVLENFSVDVTVTDANGAVGSNSLYVYVDESAPGCSHWLSGNRRYWES
jgi:hypothetical protein